MKGGCEPRCFKQQKWKKKTKNNPLAPFIKGEYFWNFELLPVSNRSVQGRGSKDTLEIQE
jgi:hypothetical protein